LEEYHEFFEKLINACLIENISIECLETEWKVRINEFQEDWGFQKALIQEILISSLKNQEKISRQSVPQVKLDYFQTEIKEKEINKWPFCLLVKIVSSYEIRNTKHYKFVGTGFYVDDYTIMTALHVFFHPDTCKKILDKDFLIYYSNEEFEKLEFEKSFYYPKMIPNQLEQNTIDMAILKVITNGNDLKKKKEYFKPTKYFKPTIITEKDKDTICLLTGFWPKIELNEKNSN